MTTYQCRAPAAALYKSQHGLGTLETELLFGETFEFSKSEMSLSLWQQGRMLTDGYEGFVDLSRLSPDIHEPTHRVKVRSTPAFLNPDVKDGVRMMLGMNALVTLTGNTHDQFVEVEYAGWLFRDHLALVGEHAGDWVAACEECNGAPYVWGGRNTARGVDCSALLQLGRQAKGFACPRNSGDIVESLLEREPLSNRSLERGAVVYGKGHVGVMLDSYRMLHTSDYPGVGRVAIQPLCVVREQRLARGDGEMLGVGYFERA